MVTGTEERHHEFLIVSQVKIAKCVAATTRVSVTFETVKHLKPLSLVDLMMDLILLFLLTKNDFSLTAL